MRIRAAVLHEPRTPLVLEDVEVAPPGPDEVLVRVAAAGVCHSDVRLADGELGDGRWPLVMGHEGAGVVEEVGAGVTHVEPGDHVGFCIVPACRACEECAAGRFHLCIPAGENGPRGTLMVGTSRLALPDGTPLGVASYLRLDGRNGSVEVGGIVMSERLQRTTASTEAMYLMMRHPFEDLGYRRYEWKCDSLNAPSRRAAERLGFSYEGRFRNALVYKGRNRDTDWLSVTDTEPWSRLFRRLGDGKTPQSQLGYDDPDMNAAMAELKAAATLEDRKAAMAEIQEIWNATMPSALYQAVQEGVIWQDHVHDLTFTQDAVVMFDDAWLES